MKKIIIFLFILHIAFYSDAQFFKEWSRPVYGSYNPPFFIAADSNGCVHILREMPRGVVNGNIIYYSTVEKYDPNGFYISALNFPDTGPTTISPCYFLPRVLKMDHQNNLVALILNADDTTWLIKMDLNENILWQIPLAEKEYDMLQIDSHDNIYAINYNSNSGGYWIKKFSSNGSLIFSQNLIPFWNVFMFNDELFYQAYNSSLQLDMFNKMDTLGNETTLFSVPSSVAINLIGVAPNRLYTYTYQSSINIRDYQGNSLFNIPFPWNCVSEMFYTDSLNNYWLIYNSYYTSCALPPQIIVRKYDSSYNLVFNEFFQIPNVNQLYVVRNPGSSLFINNELYIPYGYSDTLNQTQSTGILKVDQTGNMFSEAEFVVNYQCSGGLVPITSQFVSPSSGNNYCFTVLAGGCIPYKFHLAKFSVNGYNYSGKFFHDSNADGIYDSASDYGIASERALVLPDSSYYFSNGFGNYLITIDSLTRRVIHYDNPFGSGLTTDSTEFHITPGVSDSCCYDFGLTENQVSHDVRCDLTNGLMRCDTTAVMWLTVYNHSTVPEYFTITLTLDSLTQFISSADSIASLTGNVITWPVDTLYPFQQFQTTVTYHTPSSAHLWDTTQFVIKVNDQPTGSLLCSSIDERIVVCGYDPNDKQVSPIGITTDHFTLSTDELKYTIRFQNTGNDTAFNIHVLDDLDSHLDLNSFRIVSWSHPATVTISPKGELRCSFYHINLPDSGVDFNGSQGFFKYAMKAKNSIDLPAFVKNQARIYFDYNLPVITNKVFNTLVEHLPISVQSVSYDKTISLYPNPVSDKLYFNSGDLTGSRYFNFSIIDMQGKILKVYTHQKSPAVLNCRELNNGVYFLKADSDSGPSYFRFVKLDH